MCVKCILVLLEAYDSGELRCHAIALISIVKLAKIRVLLENSIHDIERNWKLTQDGLLNLS